MAKNSKRVTKVQSSLLIPADQIWAHHVETLSHLGQLRELYYGIESISMFEDRPLHAAPHILKNILATIKSLGYSSTSLTQKTHAGALRLAYGATRLRIAEATSVTPIVQLGTVVTATNYHELLWFASKLTHMQVLQEFGTADFDKLETMVKTDFKQLIQGLANIRRDESNTNFLSLSDFQSVRWREELTYEVTTCLTCFGKGSVELVGDKESSSLPVCENTQRSKLAYELSFDLSLTWVNIQDHCDRLFPKARPWNSSVGGNAEKAAKRYAKIDPNLPPPPTRKRFEKYQSDKKK